MRPATAAVGPATDHAWLATLAGRYTNRDLGTVTFAAASSTPASGEPRSAVGSIPDGTVKLVFLGPPFARAEVEVAGDVAGPTLAVSDGQGRYVFDRATR